MNSRNLVAVMKECKELSLQGTPFPEIVRRLLEVGVERYHFDLTRNEVTYYMPCGESHVFPAGSPQEAIADNFDADAVQATVKAIQRGEFLYSEFLLRIMAAGCVGYFAQLAGRRVQYVGRKGDMYVEPFPAMKA